MSCVTSRRALLAGIAAAPALSVPALAGGAHPDAELIGLELRLSEARERLDAACERAQEAEDRFEPPPQSEVLITTDADRLAGFPQPDSIHWVRGRTWSLEQIEEIRAAPPFRAYFAGGELRVCERTARRKTEILAAHDAYQAGFQAASDVSGLTAADAEYVTCANVVDSITEAVLKARATTLDGLAVKARTHVARYGMPSAEDPVDLSSQTLALSIIGDLVAMEGGDR